MRRPDWPERLVAFVEANRSRPHEYGSFDCLLLPAGAVKAVTGKDHGRGHRGKYTNAATGARYLRKLGFDSPEAMIDSLLEEKPTGFAQRGDIVLGADGIPALCMGEFALSAGQEGNRKGLVRVPRSEWVKAWRVG